MHVEAVPRINFGPDFEKAISSSTTSFVPFFIPLFTSSIDILTTLLALQAMWPIGRVVFCLVPYVFVLPKPKPRDGSFASIDTSVRRWPGKPFSELFMLIFKMEPSKYDGCWRIQMFPNLDIKKAGGLDLHPAKPFDESEFFKYKHQLEVHNDIRVRIALRIDFRVKAGSCS
jgi:hypothetical protein